METIASLKKRLNLKGWVAPLVLPTPKQIELGKLYLEITQAFAATCDAAYTRTALRKLFHFYQAEDIKWMIQVVAEDIRMNKGM